MFTADPLTKTNFFRASIPYLVLAATIIGLYHTLFSYPYVYDDWRVLHSIHFDGGWEYLRESLLPFGKAVYRPMGSLYYLLVVKLFNLSSIGFHAISLLLLFSNSVLAVVIVRRLTGNDLAAWSTGFFYAAAITVHLDPLLWMVGFYDIGGSFLLLLSFVLLITNRVGLSALCYFLSLLTKEGTVLGVVVFGLYLVLYSPNQAKISLKAVGSSVRVLWMHFAGLIVYIALKSVGVSPLSAHHDDPFRVVLWGGHVARNIEDLLQWSFEVFIPLKDYFSIDKWLGLVSLVLVLLTTGVVVSVMLSRDREVMRQRMKEVTLLASWTIAGTLPVLFLPNHMARYFFSFALIPFIALGVLFIQSVLSLLMVKSRYHKPILTLMLGANILGAWFLLSKLEGGPVYGSLSGTYNLLPRCKSVLLMEEYMSTHHPVLPKGATLIVDNVDPKSLDGSNALQVMYDDPSLQVIDYGDAIARKDLITAIFLVQYNGVIFEDSLKRYLSK